MKAFLTIIYLFFSVYSFSQEDLKINKKPSESVEYFKENKLILTLNPDDKKQFLVPSIPNYSTMIKFDKKNKKHLVVYYRNESDLREDFLQENNEDNSIRERYD